MDSITEDYTNTANNFKNSLANIGNNIDGYKKASEKMLSDNTAGLQKSMDQGKENMSKTASGVRAKFSGFFDFMESNSLVAKFSFLLLVIFVFIIMLGIAVNVLAKLFDNNSEQKIINGMINASSQMLTITQDPSIKGSKTIYRSNNANGGLEFTWSVWIYINDIGSSYLITCSYLSDFFKIKIIKITKIIINNIIKNIKFLFFFIYYTVNIFFLLNYFIF